MCKFRTLNPDEVELRVAQSRKTDKGHVWAQYLIYKDARVDQKLLDETVGSLRWKKDYTFLDGKLYCTVSIWNDELKEWISKQDVGTESNTEKEKGQASDAFKRACFVWGIGRELYSAPDIRIWLNDGEYYEKNGAISPKPNLFKVVVMDVEDGKISRLVIADDSNNTRFEWPAQSKPYPTESQLKSMARRIAKGENLTGQIQANFQMTQKHWMRLDELFREQTNKQ